MTPQTGTDLINPDRRQLLNSAIMGAAAAGLSGLLPLQPARAAASDAVRPFHVSVPEDDLVDLRRRLAARTRLAKRVRHCPNTHQEYSA
jgi:hypothetical protein